VPCGVGRTAAARVGGRLGRPPGSAPVGRGWGIVGGIARWVPLGGAVCHELCDLDDAPEWARAAAFRAVEDSAVTRCAV